MSRSERHQDSNPVLRSRWLVCLALGGWALLALPAAADSTSPATSNPASLADEVGRLEARVAKATTDGRNAAQSGRLLRAVRMLRHLAWESGDEDLGRRLAELETRIRSGPSRVEDSSRPKAGSLDKVGTLSGRVTRSSDGQPIEGVSVDLGGNANNSTETDSDGFFNFPDLPAGEYFVGTNNFQGYVDEIYDDIVCAFGPSSGCYPIDGTPIVVTDEGTAHIEIELEVGGSISGDLTHATGGGAFNDLTFLDLYSSEGVHLQTSLSNSGSYRFQGLPTGTYLVSASAADYQQELYDNLPCPDVFASLSCGSDSGDPISVQLGEETAGIDFDMEELAAITGQITDALTGDPIPFVYPEATATEGPLVGRGLPSGVTNEMGEYTIFGLYEGTYSVSTFNFQGYNDELYDDLPCPQGSCDPANGTPIDVQIEQETSGIDFVLEGGCVESDTSMCLADNRFRVAVTWRTVDGATGSGQATELTPDSGYFWFFGDDNIEMVVKVLDACTLPGSNKFWVFATGLTDVEVTLKITDTQTGEMRTYVNPLGTPFQPIQDTSAFDTCP